MKVFAFRSIRTRIMTTTTLLIMTVVATLVWHWAASESQIHREQKWNQAQSLATALSTTSINELNEQNWSQIRVGLDLLLKDDSDIVYILVSDTRLGNQIVAAAPNEFQEQYIPDIVKPTFTNAVLKSARQPQETYLLRDIEFPAKTLRAKRGERVIEAASEMRLATGEKIGTLRIGISLRQVDLAIADAVSKALLFGVLGVGFGLISAYILARRLSKPVRRLQRSAAKIAAGDLQHRAKVELADEIGDLAKSFNEMTVALQASFSKLQKTLESFERFVPNKFLSVIAVDGIENIQVGVASTRTMTILFCDIRGYTAMSEQMTPLETFAFLNDYLACMGQAIDQAGGFIDKYIGDAIMALFDDETTDGALHAALLMQRTLTEFNEKRSQKGIPTITVGIGIHRGEVVMGTVGFTSRIESTVVGDAVNLASRLEGLTKYYGRPILVSESLVAALRYPELFVLRLVDKSVKVKGKDEAIAIYELCLE